MINKERRAIVDPYLPPAKKRETQLKMDVGATYYTKPNPEKPQGGDSYFICPKRNIVCVANGVGDWTAQGIDAGQYTRELMQNAAYSVMVQPRGSIIPRTVLEQAFVNMKSKGSSIACITTLKQNSNDTLKETRYSLHAVNVRDSGFIVFRDLKLVFQSPTQQHRFNMPYQLGNSKKSDTPKEAEEFNMEMRAGDIVVFGTDGLFINVYPREIQRYIELTCRGDDDKRVTPEELSWLIVGVAQCNSQSRHAETPFSEASCKAGREYSRGKIDDITVLVAYIVPY